MKNYFANFKSTIFVVAAVMTILASIVSIQTIFDKRPVSVANAQNSVGNITAGGDVFNNQGTMVVVGGDPSEPSSNYQLSGQQSGDLKRLLTSALAHYRRYGNRFERRVNGDLKRQYEESGIIYRYGEREKVRQSDLSEVERIPVAIAYRKIVEDIIDLYSSVDGKKGALADAIAAI